MSALKIIIAGTRTFNDYSLLKEKMGYFLNGATDVTIVSGANPGKTIKKRYYPGADGLGERYAEDNGYALVRFPARWKALGLKAGPIRNANMAKFATHLVAFWDGKSPGTTDMIRQAKKTGLVVRVVVYNNPKNGKP